MTASRALLELQHEAEFRWSAPMLAELGLVALYQAEPHCSRIGQMGRCRSSREAGSADPRRTGWIQLSWHRFNGPRQECEEHQLVPAPAAIAFMAFFIS